MTRRQSIGSTPDLLRMAHTLLRQGVHEKAEATLAEAIADYETAVKLANGLHPARNEAWQAKLPAYRQRLKAAVDRAVKGK